MANIADMDAVRISFSAEWLSFLSFSKMLVEARFTNLVLIKMN